MAEQPELDLPSVPSHAPAASVVKSRAGFGGFSRQQIILGILLLGVAVWGMWVTKSLIVGKQNQIVAARLSTLVGEYVEAQRFSGSPPERVRAEMQAFMASLDKELQRRSASGQVVLVGEAVLTKNVPDITDSLKKAVFESGVPEPKRASIEELQRIQEMNATQSALGAPQAQRSLPTTIDPMASAQSLRTPDMSPTGQVQRQVPFADPGASVSNFGGSDVNGGR